MKFRNFEIFSISLLVSLLLLHCASSQKVHIDIPDSSKAEYEKSNKSRFAIRFANNEGQISYIFKIYKTAQPCIDPNNCLGYLAKYSGTVSGGLVEFDGVPTGEYYGVLGLSSTDLSLWNFTSANMKIYFGYLPESLDGKDSLEPYKASTCKQDSKDPYALICPKIKIVKNLTMLSFRIGDQKFSGANTLAIWTSGYLLPLVLVFYGPIGYQNQIEYQGSR